MDHEQFRNALIRLKFATSGRDDDAGISAFARWLPCDLRTAMRYANGETDIPAAVGRLLRLMIKLKLKPENVPVA